MSVMTKVVKNGLDTIKWIKSIIKLHNPNWKSYLYGSFIQGISTMESEEDFGIQCDDSFGEKLDSKAEISYLKIIYDLLKDNGFDETNEINLIQKAEIPIIKGTSEKTGIKFDFTVNRDKGPNLPL